MYSQFYEYIRRNEQKRCETLHIGRKLNEQIEVNYAGDPAIMTDPDTEELIKVWLFVGVLSYSQYPCAEAFSTEKHHARITARVHMYDYFSGISRILVLGNTTWRLSLPE